MDVFSYVAGRGCSLGQQIIDLAEQREGRFLTPVSTGRMVEEDRHRLEVVVLRQTLSEDEQEDVDGLTHLYLVALLQIQQQALKKGCIVSRLDS